MDSEYSPWSPLLEPGLLRSDIRGVADLREIVVFIDGQTEDLAILELASVLAQEHGAHLIGVFMQPEAAATTPEMFARGTGILDVIKDSEAELEKIESGFRARFEEIASRHGIRPEWRLSPHFDSEVGMHAHYADLAMIVHPSPTGPTAGPPGLMESLVLASGRPIIMFPSHCKVNRFRRILVGWNARREAIRCVADSLPLLVRADAVEVLVIDCERHAKDHGQEPGADIARHLVRHGARVEVKRLSSDGEDVGGVLLSRAEAISADLVVMGAYGHSSLSKWMFGSVTRTVLREARLPVMMSR